MPPKKVEEPEKKPLIGRVGTNLKVGIVGIPNVGKSTFFNVLTKSQAAAENFPFCTIDPNENKYNFTILLLINDCLHTRYFVFRDHLFRFLFVFHLKRDPVISFHNYFAKFWVTIRYTFIAIEMCDAELKRLKLCLKQADVLQVEEKYTPNKSVITKRKCLQSVKGYPSPASTSLSWPPSKMMWCPKVNMYYAFNEDANPFTRVSELAKSVCDCSNREYINKPNFPPPSDPFIERDPYSEDEARYKQLMSKPVCFAIFGKPGLNSKKLAKFIAEYLNCVVISPEILLQEEIEAKTDKGRWIKQVLRSGRSIGPEIIMNLIESRLNGRDVQHRGYIVEGIPLIPNDPDLDYTAYPVASSERNSFIFEKMPSIIADDVDDRKSESLQESQGYEYEYVLDEIEDEELLESGESFSSDSSRSFDLARNPFATESLRMILRDDYQWDIGNQIQEMFTTWPIKPTVIIYIMCPDPDVVHKRNQLKFDPYTGNTIDTGLWGMKEDQNEIDDSELIILDEEITNEESLVDDDLKKHLLTRVSEMRSNVEVQCRIFEKYALPCIEKQVLLHNPQHVIRVDGRTSVSRMFQVVIIRLKTLALPGVILPKKMFDEEETFVGGEESSRFSIDDDFSGKTNEEAFQDLTNKDIVASRFRWRLSQWKFTCPVALSRGHKIEGNVRNAVRFMDKLYFLSSPAAVELFVENPRPFLLPPNPRPICKIFIFGPKYSGKSNLAEFLSQTYGVKILDPQSIENREVDHRRNILISDAIEEILNEVIEELTDDLEIQREEREVERKKNLETWYREAQVVADKLIHILENSVIEKQEEKAVEKSSSTVKGLEEIEDELDKYNLTSFCTDHNLFERILWDKNILMDFAPTELLTMEAPVREMDEQDPEVAEILIKRTQKARQAQIKLTNDEISKLLVANINAAQTAPSSLGLTESGWVVDGMYEDVDLLESIIDKGVKIEEVVVIHETEPYDYLIKKWIQNYRNNLVEEDNEEREKIITEGMNESNIFEDTIPSKSLLPEDLELTELNKYVDEVKQFDINWEKIVDTIRETDAGLIDLRLSETSNVEIYVKQQIDDRYRLGAAVMTDEDKDREAEDVTESLAEKEFVEGEEEEEEEEELTPSKDNRRLGDTGIYCPVALFQHHVLWRGKEEFSAIFMDKIYLLSSQVALDKFIDQPYEFVPFKKPLESIPSLRVSFVGPIGSGKTTLATTISKEYGLVRVDFLERLDQYLKNRSIPLVGKKYEEEFTLDDEEAVEELPEDLNDRRYDCDGPTIRTFVRKYLKEGAILPNKILKECLMDFFQPPYRAVGLIFDNFPASSYDADAACDNFAVPELVIQLKCSVEETEKRMSSKLFDAWMEKEGKKKSEEELRVATEMQKVLANRAKWVSKQLKQLRRQRRAEIRITAENNEEQDEEEKLDNHEELTAVKSGTESASLLKTESGDSGDSSIEEPDEIQAEIDRANLEEESLIQYEDPVKSENWEDPDVARERIQQKISEDYESSSQNLETARAVFEENSIPWIEIDAERDLTSVLISIMKILDPYVFRNTSALERVHEIDLKTAELLLDCGYYLLSSFGRFCPVQMYENKIPFQMYSPAESAKQIYPVIHRDYIYFLVGKERLTAFIDHPLKYLAQDSCSPLIPARIAIIGPPKCGKSTIANRFANTYGMKVITRGQALRHMLRNFPWTELAILTSAHLQGGHTALNESIARAVEMDSIDPRSVSQGYILDGFPESQSEAEELAFLGIQPTVVIDLQADLDFCLGCLSTDSKTLTRPPAYSPCYLSHQYEEWQTDAERFRNWLSRFNQNVVTVDATAQKFAVWRKANHEVCLRYFQIVKYFRESDCDKAQSLIHLCISPYEFRERQSKFESYCPVCFTFNNVLTFSGTPPSNDGMVQFRGHYYWVCKNHLNHFLNDPLKILSSANDVVLSEYRAEIVDQEIDVNHSCWAKILKVSGFCPVTYLDNLPQRNIVPGSNTLGVIFRDGLFLFCSTECRDKFISQPLKYADVDINFSQSLPPVKIKNLPNLGFLEQTVAKLIVNAVNRIGVLRVKLAGMSPAITAAVYIGVYLKIHNKESGLNEITVHEEVLKRMNARRHLLQVALRNAKKMINPHVSFPLEDKAVESKIKTTLQSSSSSINSVKFRHDSNKQSFSNERNNRVSNISQSFV